VVVVGAHNFSPPIHGFIDHHCGMAIVAGHNFFYYVHHFILCKHHHKSSWSTIRLSSIVIAWVAIHDPSFDCHFCVIMPKQSSIDITQTINQSLCNYPLSLVITQVAQQQPNSSPLIITIIFEAQGFWPVL